MGRSVSGLYVFATTLVVAAVAGVSCGTNLPGRTLGTYKVTGTLTGNMCGEGIDAPDPWQFDVQLSETASTMYLNWMDASPLLSGPRTSPTEATLSGYQVANVDATGATMGPCDLQRSDLVKIALGVDTPPSSFRGTIRYTFSAQQGSDCTDQLTASGGTYSALPCGMSYSITASRE